jgi:hypothetical protein
MLKVEKILKIHPGVDLIRACAVLEMYLTKEYASKTGFDSLGIYSNGTDPDLIIYSTPTMIVVRIGDFM